MEITAGRGQRGVTQGRLNQMNGRGALQRVAGVRVTQPVGRNLLLQTGLASGSVDNAADLFTWYRRPWATPL